MPAGRLQPGGSQKDPAYLPIDKALDLKTIHPTVNVNLPRFLLKDVASGFDGGTNDPLAAEGINFPDLVKDVKLIRVVVIEAKDPNRAALDKGMKTLKERSKPNGHRLLLCRRKMWAFTPWAIHRATRWLAWQCWYMTAAMLSLLTSLGGSRLGS